MIREIILCSYYWKGKGTFYPAGWMLHAPAIIELRGIIAFNMRGVNWKQITRVD